MSDAARQNLKVSREGIVLIKSFEGFRPRAIQRAEGGWIIGYGHTLSAREGATVSESDAELLLRYDLLPVEASVNDAVPAQLNQHQFDALVSFAFSVGVDRFASSDVRQRLVAGAPGEAADAIMGWPEPALPETALRRRAAERALFVADPTAPVALSDLLSAPLPPPPVPTPVAVEPEIETAPVAVEPEPEVEPIAPTDPRGAAVAALLGEPSVRLVQEETPTIIPSFAPAKTAVETDDALAPSNDNPPTATTDIEVETDVEPETDISSPTQAEAAIESQDDASITSETDAAEGVVEILEAAEADLPADAEDSAESSVTWSADRAAWSVTRYAPYGLTMVGPLPYLQPAAPHAEAETPAIDHALVEVTPIEIEETSLEKSAPIVDTIDATTDESETPVEGIEASATETLVEDDPTPTVETDTVPASDDALPEPVAEVAAFEPEPEAPLQPMVYIAPAPVAELVLTPLEDAPEPAFARPLWTAEERDAPDGSETNLFGEDLTLTLGGSVMRHEMEFEAPAKFDWKETAPFIFMGGVGLVSFGASMAAFRRAAEQSGGSELTIIGWVLALIGLGCVGVSSINLYRKFGLPGGD